MKLSGQTVLITGGATGIGLALAEGLLLAGNRVLVCGRREDKLLAAQAQFPALEVKRCDISKPEDRQALATWAREAGVNVLVNNAGVQRMIDLRQGLKELEAGDNEARINFEGPVYLTANLLPHLLAQESAAIINVSSGLGFVPIAVMPIYCATKAAMHAFTVSLRHQLQGASVQVFEVIPPTVDTELDRGARARRGQVDRGIAVGQAAAEILDGLRQDRAEIAIAGASRLMQASRQDFAQMFDRMNHLPS